MRILLFPASYPPVLGGLQTATHALARGLSEKGHDVLVVTNQYPRWLAGRESIDGIEVHRRLLLSPQWDYMGRGRPDLMAASFYFFPSNLHWLAKLMREFQPDVINVHFPDSQIPYVLWAQHHFSFRLVVSFHGDDIERWTSGTEQRPRRAAESSMRELLRGADAVTACSQYLMGQTLEIEKSITDKSHVIPNGISVERFEDKSRHPHPRPYIFAYGRLVRAKGFDLLLRAFTQIAPIYPEIDLIIGGEGGERAAMESLRVRSGVSGRIHFHGRATQPEVVRLLNGCCLVVIPSRQEPFGIVALEALAANRPVLATRVGGLPEATRGADVSLVEPTVEGLLAGLKAKLQTDALATQPAQPKPVLTSWTDVAERYVQIYEIASGRSWLCPIIRPASAFS